jgi:hypothetical protein
MKQMMAASASAAQGTAVQDVATVFGFIQHASQIAARPLLRRADIDRAFKDVTGCTGGQSGSLMMPLARSFFTSSAE